MKVTKTETRESYIGVCGYFDQTILTLEGLNTSGKPETYLLILDGTYDGGSARLSMLVQRTNGMFASIHRSNARHIYRRAASAAKKEIKQYEAAFTGYRKESA